MQSGIMRFIEEPTKEIGIDILHISVKKGINILQVKNFIWTLEAF